MKQLKKTVLILLLAIGMTLGMVPLAAAPVHAEETKDAVEEDAPAAPDTTEIQEAPAAEGKNDAGNTGVVNETPDENALKLNVSEAESYSLWVGGVQVTDANKGNIPVERGSASYDSDSKTLTLNNADIGTGDIGIDSGMDLLTIKLEGTNTISRYGTVCIRSTGSVIITGSGALNVTTRNNTAIRVNRDLTVNSGEVTAKTNGARYTAFNAENIFITGGKVTAGAGDTNSNAVFAGNSVNISGGELDASGRGSLANAVYADKEVNISGGTVTAKASGSSAGAVYGVSGVNVSGGTVTLEASGSGACGIKTGYGKSTTIKGDARLTALGQDQAIRGTVKNHIAGLGWNDNYGNGRKIPVNTGGQELSYKKVKFPDKVLYTVTIEDNKRVQVYTDKKAAYQGDTVTVKAWPMGSYSPAVYVTKTSDGTTVQEVELAFNGQTFAGTFTMPDYDVTLVSKALAAGDATDEDKNPTNDSGNGKSASSKSPNTGDEQNVAGWAAMMIASASALAALVIKRKGILHR